MTDVGSAVSQGLKEHLFAPLKLERETRIMIIRNYTGEDGKSHFEDITLSFESYADVRERTVLYYKKMDSITSFAKNDISTTTGKAASTPWYSARLFSGVLTV